MMRRLAGLVTWGSVAAAVAGFFLPWAHLDVHEPHALQQLGRTADNAPLLGELAKAIGRVTVEVRRGAETITGELPTLKDFPGRVTGFDIPQVANQRDAKVAMALAEAFTRTRHDIGAQSYAVYALPALALLSGALLTVLGRRVVVTLGVVLLGTVVAGVGSWQLLTMKTDLRFVAITVGQGLWLSLWAYAGLAFGAALHLVSGDDARIDSASSKLL